MKIGTHSLGNNAFAQTTLVKVNSGGLVISQLANGKRADVNLSANQIALLKEITHE